MPVPEPVLEAAHRALAEGRNRYTRTWGAPELRHELARFLRDCFGLTFDPETEIVVTCGACEAIIASLLALLSPGDAAIVPEPIYENYLPGIRLAGAEAVILPIDPFTGVWDPVALERALGRARVLILNTPANPIGKVWTREELEIVADLVERHDAVLVTDETYAFITAPGHAHVAPASVGRLASRTVTNSSFSKTYAVTGWRVGFAAAPAPLMAAIRKVHDFLTVCAPAPFQLALVEALRLPDRYYREMSAEYRRRHDLLASGLQRAGWRTNQPQGTYYLLVDLRDLGIDDDREWTIRLARERGVAGVPGSAFLWEGLPQPPGRQPNRRGTFLRFSFGKDESVIRDALARLGRE